MLVVQKITIRHYNSNRTKFYGTHGCLYSLCSKIGIHKNGRMENSPLIGQYVRSKFHISSCLGQALIKFPFFQILCLPGQGHITCLYKAKASSASSANGNAGTVGPGSFILLGRPNIPWKSFCLKFELLKILYRFFFIRSNINGDKAIIRICHYRKYN